MITIVSITLLPEQVNFTYTNYCHSGTISVAEALLRLPGPALRCRNYALLNWETTKSDSEHRKRMKINFLACWKTSVVYAKSDRVRNKPLDRNRNKRWFDHIYPDCWAQFKRWKQIQPAEKWRGQTNSHYEVTQEQEKAMKNTKDQYKSDDFDGDTFAPRRSEESHRRGRGHSRDYGMSGSSVSAETTDLEYFSIIWTELEGVLERLLLRNFHLLLEGLLSDWFVTFLDELEDRLIKFHFGSPNQDRRIHWRKPQRGESLIAFVITIEKINRMFSKPLSEDDKVWSHLGQSEVALPVENVHRGRKRPPSIRWRSRSKLPRNRRTKARGAQCIGFKIAQISTARIKCRSTQCDSSWPGRTSHQRRINRISHITPASQAPTEHFKWNSELCCNCQQNVHWL